MKNYQFLNFDFELKTKAKFGAGEALNLGKYLKEMALKSIGLILDPGISEFKYTKDMLANIKKEGFKKIKIWKYDLKGEPDYDSLDRIKLLFLGGKKPSVDCFVAIGGGSCIDFAKGLATIVKNPGPALNYRGFPTDINPSLPTIVLPTTAGTGSEATFNAVFINWKEKKKMGINTKYNFPAMAILDPLLTLSCPKPVIASSGVDAIVHCLEGYVSKKTSYLTKIFAREGFGLMFNNLSKILKSPKNIAIRANLQLGAYLGGLTLLGSGGGPTGALSYVFGVNFKVPHGLAGGVFLPYIIEHNIKKGYDYSELYDLIGGSNKALSKKDKNQKFIKEIFGLWQKLGIPFDIKTFGVNKNNVDILLREVKNFEKAFAQNPIPFSVKDGKKLLLKLIK
ncbi:MAG: iron-containing alcohol dehydrogenase [Candidatus Azambacteria bacterium]|nr:iron-containing alcohol dehydrogenase [Candidatus Azambacteria bacterium]